METKKTNDQLKAELTTVNDVKDATAQETTSKKRSKAVFYVSLPDKAASDDDDDDEKPTKKPKTTLESSNLADLLPAPKNPNPTLKKTQNPPQLISPVSAPRRTTAKAPSPSVESPPPPAEESQDESESDSQGIGEAEDTPTAFTGSFFRVGKTSTDSPAVSEALKQKSASTNQTTKPAAAKAQAAPQPDEIDDPNAMYAYSADPSAYYQYYYANQEQEPSQDSTSLETLDADILKQLGGKRRGESSNVQIKTVSQSDLLPSEEWRRKAQDLEPVRQEQSTLEVNEDQRRTNNIMSLAAKAQSMRSQLEQRYSKERVAKQESRRKYGF